MKVMQQQEADMQAADHQAGQRVEGRDDELVGGKASAMATSSGQQGRPRAGAARRARRTRFLAAVFALGKGPAL
jgi:hypothetical protein